MILDNLSKTLSDLGIRSGDSLCVFSDLTCAHIPVEGRNLVHERGIQALVESYAHTLLHAVKPAGCLLMPTFTYSACHNETYDPDLSPSQVGLLTEYFRCQNQVQRSLHPIFSFAGIGGNVEELTRIDTYDCFGVQSFFDKMIRRQGKYLLFGVDFQKSATFVYYSLQKMRVSYRYFKTFKADVRMPNGIQSVDVNYFVNDLQSNVRDDWNEIERLALSNGVVREEWYSGARILLTASDEIDSYICGQLNRNPNILVQEKNV